MNLLLLYLLPTTHYPLPTTVLYPLPTTREYQEVLMGLRLQCGYAVRVVSGSSLGGGTLSTCTHQVGSGERDDQPCARDASEHTQAGACNFDYKPHEDSVPRDRMPYLCR